MKRVLFFVCLCILACSKVFGGIGGVKYTTGKVWLISIGINDYGSMKYTNCVSDAKSFADYFESQVKLRFPDSSLKEFILINGNATKDSIDYCLNYIITKAGKNDYFIFNFSGVTTSTPGRYASDTINDQIYFCPFGTDIRRDLDSTNMSVKDARTKKRLFSLSSFEQKMKFIQADKQLFVVEAGLTANFKTEFIKGLVQNADRVLNDNRIIIVPNRFGWDQFGEIKKGPINYFITSLNKEIDIFSIFDPKKKNKVVYELKKGQYKSPLFSEEYFDIFFVRDYIDEMEQFTGVGGSRGLDVEMDKEEAVRKYASKKMALVIGTNHYNPGWPNLSNPVNDAVAVKTELEKNYGFEVKLLKDADMDTIYSAIRDFSKNLDTSSQLLIYIAGHGHKERNFLDDNFIVCHDSRPVDQDPNMTTYISHSKLKRMINKLPARQILLVLDICYGGASDRTDELNNYEETGKKDGNQADFAVNLPSLQRLSVLSKYKTRILISSVGDRKALDGWGNSKYISHNSPFATLFLKCLRNNANGKLLTATNIYSALQDNSMSDDVNNMIEPYKNPFGDNESHGEFVLIPLPSEKAEVNTAK